MKKVIFSILFLLVTFIGYGQFINTTTTGNATTLFKSKGGIGADSAFILLNNYADTTAANFSVASKYSGSFIRVDTSIYYRTLNPNKWNLFAKVGSTGTIVSISQGFGIVNTPNPITTTGTVTVDTLAMSTKANVRKVTDSTIGLLSGYVRNTTGSVNNRLAIYDGATGKIIKNSKLNLVDYNESDASLSELYTGTDTSGFGRQLDIFSGSGTTGGAITLRAGESSIGNAVNAEIYAGRTLGANGDGGNVVLAPTGGLGSGVSGGISLDFYKDSSGISTIKRGVIKLDNISTNPSGSINVRTWQMPNASGTIALQGDTTGFGTKFIYNQTGSNLSAQSGKFWVSDTIRTSGYLYGQNVYGLASNAIPAVTGINSSTGRGGSFFAQSGIGVAVQNTSSTNPALKAIQNSTSDIAQFYNSFDLGVSIDTSGNIKIANIASSGNTGTISLPAISANRTYTLPNASGTIALTSNVTDSSSALRAAINTKLNISDTAAMKATITLDRVLQAGNTTGRTFTAGGATLTGALSGTSGAFSDSLSFGTWLKARRSDSLVLPILGFGSDLGGSSSADISFGNEGLGDVIFFTNGDDRGRIQENGRWLIGNPADDLSTKFQVDGVGSFTLNQNATSLVSVTNTDATNSNSRAAFRATSNTVQAGLIAINGLGSFIGSESNHGTDIITNGTSRILISATGDVAAPNVYTATVGGTNRDVFVDNTGLIGYVSSFRASKKNIQPLSNTSWLHQLNPVKFNYRIKDSLGRYTDSAYKELEYGLIAEEVEPINKEMVFYDVDSTGKHLRGVHYSKLIVPMLKEIQDQKKTITALEARIAKLEAIITGTVRKTRR